MSDERPAKSPNLFQAFPPEILKKVIIFTLPPSSASKNYSSYQIRKRQLLRLLPLNRSFFQTTFPLLYEQVFIQSHHSNYDNALKPQWNEVMEMGDDQKGLAVMSTEQWKAGWEDARNWA
ncbi:hypothetical protein JCM5353_008008, partial [Sporobolomyces roseus]